MQLVSEVMFYNYIYIRVHVHDIVCTCSAHLCGDVEDTLMHMYMYTHIYMYTVHVHASTQVSLTIEHMVKPAAMAS